MNRRHFFITGLPTVGKTTAVQRIIQSLPGHWSGFITENVFHQNVKQGMRLKSLNGLSLDIPKQRGLAGSFSDYMLDVHAFDRFFLQAFESPEKNRRMVIDELGPLFCLSGLFTLKTGEWLDQFCFLGTIARRGHALIEAIHRRADAEIVAVTSHNRDEIVQMAVTHFTKQEK